MRVIVNQATALGQKTGIGHYTDQLLHHLRECAGADEIHAFPTGWVRSACETYTRTRSALYTGRDNQEPAAAATGSLLGRLRRGALAQVYRRGHELMAWHFRSLCARRAFDLYHEPNVLPLPSDRLTVATIHDLSLLLHPEWHTAERAAHFERNLPRALKQSAHVLTDSDFIRQQVIEILNVPAERVTRVYLGIRPALRPLPATEVARALGRLGLPPNYLLYVGTIEPRKNLLPLLRAYCDLPAALRERWPFLLVGNWGWNARAVADYFHATARHQGVMHLGYLPDGDLAALYNGARALTYPSLYEGFGLPPLEMMACGGAVLASTAETLVETMGRKAHLVDPDDVAGWRAGLQRVLTDDDWWRSLRAGSTTVAQRFTWQQCALETLGTYRKVCGLPLEHGQRRQAG